MSQHFFHDPAFVFYFHCLLLGSFLFCYVAHSTQHHQFTLVVKSPSCGVGYVPDVAMAKKEAVFKMHWYFFIITFFQAGTHGFTVIGMNERRESMKMRIQTLNRQIMNEINTIRIKSFVGRLVDMPDATARNS